MSFPKLALLLLIFMVSFLLGASWGRLSADPVSPSKPLISDVGIDKDVFNPTAQEKVKISFHLLQKAEVSIKIFDCDQELIATLCYQKMMEKGNNTVFWNGCDQNQKIVPDEAYFFTIEARCGSEREVYDPTSFSGGISHEIERIKILPEKEQVEYYLPEKGRVFMRAGIHNGPLLAILVDWEPRSKGWHREHWDGMGQEKLISVLKHPRYRIRTSYFTLPENAIITKGNQGINYLEYKRSQEKPAPQKVFSTSRPRSILISPLYNVGMAFTKSPPIEVSFPQAPIDETGIPVFKGKIRVRVDLPQKWSALLSQQQYEIYFFLDSQFLTEEPWIRLPYETILEVGEHTPGTYILSVNIISPKGQIGIKSKKVKLQQKEVNPCFRHK